MGDNINVLKILIDNNIYIHQRDLNGFTPLLYCVQYRSYNCLRKIIKYSDINEKE